jgi:hypothetical protein
MCAPFEVGQSQSLLLVFSLQNLLVRKWYLRRGTLEKCISQWENI